MKVGWDVVEGKMGLNEWCMSGGWVVDKWWMSGGWLVDEW